MSINHFLHYISFFTTHLVFLNNIIEFNKHIKTIFKTTYT